MVQRRGVIALDVGGTKIACGLVLLNGDVLFSSTQPTSVDSSVPVVAQIAGLVSDALDRTPRDVTAMALGIAVPGWVDRRNRTVWAPNVAGWDHIPLEQQLATQIPLPLVLESDRSGYVRGETWLGVARGLRDVVFLAVGTGIGAGIMVDGRIVHGHDDLAGAVGWMALNPAFIEPYARMGCFEAEASGNALGRKGIERFERLAGKAPGPRAGEGILRAAIAGEAWSVRLIDEVSVYLGMGVANLVSTLNPEMVVLGGGLFRAGEYLLDKVRTEFVRWSQPFAARRVRLELSTLGERAGLLGAARIAIESYA